MELITSDPLRPLNMPDAEAFLTIIDQTRLPQELVWLELKSAEAVWEAIHNLRVRGAPAIGVAVAYGVYQATRESMRELAKATGEICQQDLLTAFSAAKSYLASARPTAVNLFWALDRMAACLQQNLKLSTTEILAVLFAEARAIEAEDAWICDRIAEYGLPFITDRTGILTHCNAGRLATAGVGTALGPIYLAHQRGLQIKVYADETRPLLQGARLTAFELQQAGIETTLICDNMAATVMRNGWIQAVFVGADRIAANGDTANKIGTSGVAILAKHYGVPFYVCAPTSTIDPNCSTGQSIVIEERAANEVTTSWYSQRMAPAGIDVFNPAFDVTDASLITGIITEYGVAKPPFTDSIREIFLSKG